MASYLEELGMPTPAAKGGSLPGQTLSPFGGIIPSRQKTIDRPELTPEEAAKAGELLARQGVWTDLVEGTGSVLDNITMAFDTGTDWVMDAMGMEPPAQKPAIVRQAEKDIARRKAEEKLWNEVSTQPLRGGAYAVPEMAAYVVPTLRMGTYGKGLAAIPKTMANWGAADYTISRMLNKSHEEAMVEGAIAALFGLPFGGYRAYKTMQKASLGGGTGVPPEVELAMEPTKQGLEGMAQKKAREVMELRRIKDNLKGKSAPAVDEDIISGGFAEPLDEVQQLRQTIDSAISMDEIATADKALETIERLKTDDRYLRNKIINEMMEDAGIPYKATDDMGGSYAMDEGAPVTGKIKEPERIGVQAPFRKAANEIMKDDKLKEFYRQEMIDSVMRRSKLKEGDEIPYVTESERLLSERRVKPGEKITDESTIDLVENPVYRQAQRDAYAEQAKVSPPTKPFEPRTKLPEKKSIHPKEAQRLAKERRALDTEYARIIRENTPAKGKRSPEQQKAINDARERLYGDYKPADLKKVGLPEFDDTTLARTFYSDLPKEVRQFISKADFDKAKKRAKENVHKAKQLEMDAQRIREGNIPKVKPEEIGIGSGKASRKASQTVGPEAAGLAKVKESMESGAKKPAPAVDEFGNEILDPRKKYKIDTSKLTKAERTRFEKYQQMMKDGKKLTKAQNRSYVKLMEKMQEPRKVRKTTKMERFSKDNIPEGMSEDEWAEIRKRELKGESFDREVRELTDDDIAELDRMYENAERTKTQDFVRKFKETVDKMEYDPRLKDIATKLASKLGDTEIRIVDDALELDGRPVLGYYDPQTRTITMRRKAYENNPEIVIHEMVHAATLDAVRGNKALSKELTDMIERFLKDNPEFSNTKYTQNPEEFLAYGLTDAKFVGALKSTPTSGGSLWDSIKNAVAKFLGIKPLTSEWDNLNRILEESLNPGMSKSTKTSWDKFAENFSAELKPALVKLKGLKDIDFKDAWNQTKANWTSSISDSEIMKQYRELHSLTRNALNQSAKARGFFVKTIEKSLAKIGEKPGGKFDVQFHESVLRTDYAAIREFGSKKEALDFIKENRELFETAKDMIDVLAKSMKDKRFMNNTLWRPNGYAIAEAFTDWKLPKGMDIREAGRIIDKMVSIRSLTNSDWAFIAKHRGSETFEEMLNMNDILRAQSDNLFQVDPLNRIKGYVAEEYDGIYEYVLNKETGQWTKRFKLDEGRVQGAMPMNMRSGVMGETWFPREAFKDFLNMSDEEIDQIFKKSGSYNKVQSLLMDIADTHNLGFILNNGKVVGVRRVAGEAQRLSMGKVISATRVMGLTYENGIRKMLTRDDVITHILGEVRTGKSKLFKNYRGAPKDMEPPPGYSALTAKEREALPKQLRDTVIFVKTEMKDMIFGFEKAKVFGNQMTGAVEQVLKDSVRHFKLNVVMKNPASWLNNAMFGMFMNMQHGISPANHVRYFKTGLKAQREADGIVQRMMDMAAKGDTDSARYQRLKSRLEENIYYRMNKEGLAVTVMTNILDTPSGSKMFTDKLASKWVDDLFGKETGEKIKKIFTNIHLDPKSKAGQYAMNIFGAIDSQSRFAMAYDYMLKKGWKPGTEIDEKLLREAVDESNAVYGDLDMVTTKWSHALQSYGAIPFSNWFFRASAGLYKSFNEHPIEAMAIGLGLYALQEATEKRTSSWNPLATFLETPMDMATMSPYGEPTQFIRSATEPAVYRKLYNSVKYQDPTSVVITDKF